MANFEIKSKSQLFGKNAFILKIDLKTQNAFSKEELRKKTKPKHTKLNVIKMLEISYILLGIICFMNVRDLLEITSNDIYMA